MRQLERAAEAFGRGAIIPQAPVQFADNRVEEIVGLEPLSLWYRVNRVESGLGPVHLRHRHRPVECHHR